MKKSIMIVTVGCILAIASPASADQPIEAYDYSFITYSPTSEAYGVQAVLDTTTSNWSVRTRFHVFDTPSGSLLWQSETNYGSYGQVHLAPDPNYIVCVNKYFSTQDLKLRGWEWPVTKTSKTMADGKDILVSSVNTNLSNKAQQDWLKGTWAVRIYKRGQLLRSYSLNDLDIPFVCLRFSVSHAYFAEISAHYVPRWSVDPFACMSERGTNPRFLANRVLLNCLDNKTREFNLKTGELITTDETERLQQSPGGDVLKASPQE